LDRRQADDDEAEEKQQSRETVGAKQVERTSPIRGIGFRNLVGEVECGRQ
jgi:hypothetical protein